ncbi:MAG: hypothetical protein JW940_20490 [Polyangiaceae bacterium]|nr:hypothetical protein [Polyangiaceae bacterium]
MRHRAIRGLVLGGAALAGIATACGVSERSVREAEGGHAGVAAAAGSRSTESNAGTAGTPSGSDTGGKRGSAGGSSETGGTAGTPSESDTGGKRSGTGGSKATAGGAAGTPSESHTGGKRSGTGGSKATGGGTNRAEGGEGGGALVVPTGGAGGAPSGGTSGEAGSTSEPTAGAPNPGACTDGARRCAGDTPEKCVDGQWVKQKQCSGTTPVCSNGICGVARLRGGLVTVGGAISTGTIRLVDHGFEYLARSCGTVKEETVCVAGAIRP